jgi:hypothetical protein
LNLPALLSAVLLLPVLPGMAAAACPVELAAYANAGSAAEVEFGPSTPSATVTNTFRMIVGELVLEGIVQWSEGIERPYGMLTRDCPKGDVTGAEISACTAWTGVVYASDLSGNIGLLPAEGEPAPDRLLFPDLAQSLADALGEGDGRLAGARIDGIPEKGCPE